MHQNEQDGNGQFRIDFEAELRYGSESQGHFYEKQPAFLDVDAAGARQSFDVSMKRQGGIISRPSYKKSAIFDVLITDVVSLKWNEVTGAVHLDTVDRAGRRALRPLFYADRPVAVDGAERMARLWFPAADLIRTEMSEKEVGNIGLSSRIISAVMALVAVAVIVAVILTGMPWFVAIIFLLVAVMLVLLVRSSQKYAKSQTEEAAELLADGHTWVEVTNPLATSAR